MIDKTLLTIDKLRYKRKFKKKGEKILKEIKKIHEKNEGKELTDEESIEEIKKLVDNFILDAMEREETIKEELVLGMKMLDSIYVLEDDITGEPINDEWYENKTGEEIKENLLPYIEELEREDIQ